VRDMSAGAVLGTEDVAVLRSEKNLSPGIEPQYLENVSGARLAQSISAGAGGQWNHLIQTG